MTEKPLTPQQRLFVVEFLVDLNKTQAAIRAGYSERTAAEQGARLFRNVKVAAAIELAMAKRAAKVEVSAARVLEELAKIGFSDIRKAVDWAERDVVEDDEDGVKTIRTKSAVLLRDAGDIDDDTAAAIQSISEGPNGVSIKFHDKRAALVDIGRHLGMFKTKVELTGKDGGPVETAGRVEVDLTGWPDDLVEQIAALQPEDGED